jgi:hypothetical protein
MSSEATRRVVLITGASGGIGADLARVFARRGHDLALVARSREKLEALADELATPNRPRPLVFALDLEAQGAVEQLAKAMEAAGAAPDILINNAGFGLVGACADLDPGQQLAIIDLNIRALVEMTLRFLPAITAARGKIMNVGSVASFFPGGPGMTVYYASKAFVRSFTLALGQEMRAQGVTVTSLCPGVTLTSFQSRAGFTPKMGLGRLPSQTAMEVAEAGYAALMAGRREAVPGLFNKLTTLGLPFLPKALILSAISRLQQKRRGDA